MTERQSEVPTWTSAAVVGREQAVARTFVELADTLVDEFDVLEFLHMLTERCVELLDVAAAGVILSDERGGLRMAATSSQRSELLEMFAVQSQDGPCVDCVRSGQSVASPDLTVDGERWPRFTAAAGECGFAAVQALPLRLRGNVIGAVSLLKTETGPVDEQSAQLGRALADVATIGILQQRAIESSAVVSEQLQTALNSRVVIEQAKGVLSERGARLDMEGAFAALRGYARSHNLRLSALARAVAEGTADVGAILDHVTVTAPRHPEEHRQAETGTTGRRLSPGGGRAG
jgi:transcriptional regulator with GAF, ATPase, and Fis domain